MRVSPAFAASAAALLLGLAGGTALDEAPGRAPQMRGGYRVLDVDLHAHTRFSDGLLSPTDIVVLARRRGLDAVAVTEHNLVFPGKIARWFSERVGGPIVLVGEEVTRRGFHVHAIGIEEWIDWDQPIEAVVAAAHEQGGIAIGAHPFGRFRRALRPVLGELDGVEVVHPVAYFEGGGRWAEIRDFYEQARADGFDLAPIAASDYHFFSVLGLLRTHVFVREATARGILDAVKDGRTVVHDLHGRAYGRPDLVALLEHDPLPAQANDFGYFGSGATDRVTRTVGWLGLLGCVVFAPRRRRARALALRGDVP